MSKQLDLMKQEARRLKKSLEVTHTQALEIVAKKHGYDSWHHAIKKADETRVR